MAGLPVTAVTPGDYSRLVEVWVAAVRATHDFLNEADIEMFMPKVIEGLPKLHLACCRDASGEVMGFVGVTGTNIDMLFIHPAAHGQGVGRTLMRHAVMVLGADTVDVNEQNGGARAFYRQLGFTQVGRDERDGFGKPYPMLHLRLTEFERL